jgi:hypothetical protein
MSIEFVYVRNAFKRFVVVNSCLFTASSQSLKHYSLDVLLVYEVKCIDEANGLLFDLHCCKDMLLVPLS